MEARTRLKCAYRAQGHLRTLETDDALGTWKPVPWIEASKPELSSGETSLPKGCVTMQVILGQRPPKIIVKLCSVTILRACKARARRGPPAGATRRRAQAIYLRESRIARAARAQERARRAQSERAHKRPEGLEAVRKWHGLDRARRQRIGPPEPEYVESSGPLPNPWVLAAQVARDRKKRAREDRAGQRGRSAVLRARQVARELAGTVSGKRGHAEGNAADLYGRSAALRARQESVHILSSSGQDESAGDSQGAGSSGVWIPSRPLSRGEALVAQATRAYGVF